jgi:hypothetical protein
MATKEKSAPKSSVYQSNRYLSDTRNFNSYKKPTMVSNRQSEYDTLSQPTTSASDYLRKKYGDFSSATTIAPPPAPKEPQTTIQGKERLTQGDLELLAAAMDQELLVMQNTRSASMIQQAKQAQLDLLVTDVYDLLGKVKRGELNIQQVPIRPDVARNFLQTFRKTDLLPTLLEPDGLLPILSAPSPTPNAAPSAAPSAASEGTSPDLTQALFSAIQNLRWIVHADYDSAIQYPKQVLKRLGDMEKRILEHASSDTPLPEAYQKAFETQIHAIEASMTSNFPQ